VARQKNEQKEKELLAGCDIPPFFAQGYRWSGLADWGGGGGGGGPACRENKGPGCSPAGPAGNEKGLARPAVGTLRRRGAGRLGLS